VIFDEIMMSYKDL